MVEWRKLVCGVMIVVVPASLMAQDAPRAMLHNDGGVWLNANPAPSSSAIFEHDLIRTQKETRAKIDAAGTTVTVEPETIVQFEGNELALEHGHVQVNTWRGMRVRVDCLTVIPPPQEWARYDVIDVDGKVLVLAYQNDVKIHYRGTAAWRAKHVEFSDVTVYQGGEATREERCAAAPQKVAAKGPFLESPWTKIAVLAIAGTLICLGICHTDDPVSPSKP